MTQSSSATKKTALSVIAVGTILWLFLTLSWHGLAQTTAFHAGAIRWNEAAGTPGWLPRIFMCLVLVAGIFLIQHTRRIESLAGAALVGLLIGVLSVPAKLSLGSGIGLDLFVLLRETILVVGMVVAAIAVYRLRANGR